MDQLTHGRQFFEQQQWVQAFAHLHALHRESPLEPDDLERLAIAARLAGRERESADAWTRAHQQFLSCRDVPRAVRCAFWLANGLFNAGEVARGGAWIARGRRLLDDYGPDCVEQGYLLLPVGLQLLDDGDASTAIVTLRQAAEVAERFEDSDLMALAYHAWGRALIRAGQIAEGIRRLDDAMVAVETGDVSPIVIGDVYCSVISGCLEVFDVRRAQEWTAALTHWCDSQPDLMLYRGQCLVRQAEVMVLHGEWEEAVLAAERACAQCQGGIDQAAAGPAFYQRAELHRLRGEFSKAEHAYQQAVRWGRKPQPGLALLRLAQGQIEPAVAAIRSLIDVADERRIRSRLLPAYVEIMLVAGDVPAAREAADELAAMALEINAPFVSALAACAEGAVLLAEQQPRAAVPHLRKAWSLFHELDAAYEAARVQVLLGIGGRELGDTDTAKMELDAARWTFERLGAAPDIARVNALCSKNPLPTNGLTARQVQVLRLIAAGSTNRQIAQTLIISEKTVARHVSNIFMKLGLSSRAAATAYAYQHDLV